MTIHFINVGMGDSELIQTPSGRTMLIDAGDEDHGKIVADYLKKLGITSLDVVVASNPSNGNIGGMADILNNFTINEFIDSGDTHNPQPYYNRLISLINKQKIPYRIVKAGDTFPLDSSIHIEVLNPQVKFSDSSSKNSIVLKMTYNNTSLLFMGNAWGDVENTIADTANHVNILKVGYSANSISTSSEFLSKIRPNVSIIESSGDTTFGLTSPLTIDRLRKSGSEVYRTDLNGTIKVITDGNTYSVTTER